MQVKVIGMNISLLFAYCTSLQKSIYKSDTLRNFVCEVRILAAPCMIVTQKYFGIVLQEA